MADKLYCIGFLSKNTLKFKIVYFTKVTKLKLTLKADHLIMAALTFEVLLYFPIILFLVSIS